MPVYDSVLGARLVTGNADAARQLEVAVSTDDLSAGDRMRELEKLRAIAGTHAELVIEGEEGERYLLVVTDTSEMFAITESRAADHNEPAHGAYMPTVGTRVDPDEVLELLAHEDAEVGDDGIVLPYHWPDRDALLADLAKIGPLLDGRTILLAEAGGHRYDVELAYGAVTCTPLHPRCAHLDRVLAIAPDLAVTESAVTVPFDAAVKRAPATARDPSQPLVTGSARERLDAFNTLTDHGRKRVDLAPLIAAARDDANREDRHAELRRKLYHYLAKHDTPEVGALWLWALREESDELAKTVTYIGWRLEALVARLPDELRDAEARGDTRTAARIRKLQLEAR